LDELPKHGETFPEGSDEGGADMTLAGSELVVGVP